MKRPACWPGVFYCSKKESGFSNAQTKGRKQLQFLENHGNKKSKSSKKIQVEKTVGGNDMEKREEIRARVVELLDRSRKRMEESLDRLLEGGGVGVEAYEGGYYLPKAIMVALHREAMGRYGVNNKAFMREADNLYSMI